MCKDIVEQQKFINYFMQQEFISDPFDLLYSPSCLIDKYAPGLGYKLSKF